jgi:ribosomal 30S subunit maturation factor RimM
MNVTLPATMAERRMQVGYVRSVNPARRQMRIAVLPGCAERLAEAPWIFLVLDDGSEMRCRVETVIRPSRSQVAARSQVKLGNELRKRHSAGDEWTVVLAAGVTRDNVSRARNASVMINCDPACEEERAAPEWIGFRVVDSAGVSLGTIVNMYWTGANSVIEIARGGGGALLAPAIDPVIARVDAAEKLVVLGDYAPYSVEERKARR